MEEWINYKLRNTEGAVRPFARARQIPEPWIRKWLMVLSSTLPIQRTKNLPPLQLGLFLPGRRHPRSL